jgi:hypothetical protein
MLMTSETCDKILRQNEFEDYTSLGHPCLLVALIKGKGKVIRLHAMEAHEWRGGTAPAHSQPRH